LQKKKWWSFEALALNMVGFLLPDMLMAQLCNSWEGDPTSSILHFVINDVTQLNKGPEASETQNKVRATCSHLFSNNHNLYFEVLKNLRQNYRGTL
jgi:hypothetical protein